MNRISRPFIQARKFVRSLNLTSTKEWQLYCKNKIPGLPPKPKDIPANPYCVYRNEGFVGMADWLRKGSYPPNYQVRFSFKEARKFARSLELKSIKEWKAWIHGALPDKPPKPVEMPFTPYTYYRKKGWKNWCDWLGSDEMHVRAYGFLPYDKARKYIRSLKIDSSCKWYKYCKGELPGIPPRPKNVPAAPHRVYKNKGWAGWTDWLGTSGKKKKSW